ncbi:hypothetical protein N8000_05335 [Rhodospirillales bacterium]|nr:hypothetical protein [Rhodospirillales bacterium]
MMPMDNSTDPPFRDLTFENVEDAFGRLSDMRPDTAKNVLEEVVCSPPWMRRDESDDVLKALITQANLWQDEFELVNLGLEDLVHN